MERNGSHSIYLKKKKKVYIGKLDSVYGRAEEEEKKMSHLMRRTVCYKEFINVKGDDNRRIRVLFRQE